MGAAVVQREDMPALVHEKDRAMATVHNKSALGFQLLKSARAHEVRGLSIHGRLIRQAVRASTIDGANNALGRVFGLGRSRRRLSASASLRNGPDKQKTAASPLLGDVLAITHQPWLGTARHPGDYPGQAQGVP